LAAALTTVSATKPASVGRPHFRHRRNDSEGGSLLLRMANSGAEASDGLAPVTAVTA
jgi:hypothetical protein